MEYAYSFAEVTCGDISALFVFRVAAPSTSVDRHTWWFIEDVGRSPEFPAHIDTHFPGHALSLPPFHLYTCIHTGSKTNTTAVNRSFFSAAIHVWQCIKAKGQTYMMYKCYQCSMFRCDLP